jgi:hypothetical protein
MTDHPAPQQPGEVVRHDQGGWISGPSASTEFVPAEQVGEGDVLLLDGEMRAEVTDIRYGYYWFPAGRQQGVSIGWKSGTSSGLLFRKASDSLHRITP